MEKPQKTFADYLVIAISPVLIMVLVGSLAFFLIQVFYRGEMVHGIRWLMFWFVLAIVLVSRLSIEQSTGHAVFYGAALAVATWFYLAYTQNAAVSGMMLGVILLGSTWFCAHKLTVDCTLIKDEAEDDPGEGVLQGMLHKLEELVVEPRRLPPPLPLPLSAAELMAIADMKTKMRAQPRAPGRWVIYFSLFALPLFGLGQLLLPRDDPAARRVGFAFLALYLSAALCLLMTTSFLGLRRYLRKRLVEMPTNVAFSWIRCGVILIGVVLALALILPRPDASKPRKELAYKIEHKEHKASDVALPFNPPGQGEGTPGDVPRENNQPGVDSKKAPPGNGTHVAQSTERGQSNPRNQPAPNPSDQGEQAGQSGPAGGGAPAGEPGQASERAPSGKPGPPGNLHPSSGSPSGNRSPGRPPAASTPELAPPGGNGIPSPGNGEPEKNLPRPGAHDLPRPNAQLQPPQPGSVGNLRAQADSPPENRGPSGDPGGTDRETRERDGEMPARPPGNGIPSQGSDRPGKDSPPEVRKKEPPPPAPEPRQIEPPRRDPENTTQAPKPPGNVLGPLLRVVLIVAIAALFVWLAVKYRKAIAEAIRSFIAAVREFFRKLFSFRWRRKHPVAADVPASEPVLPPFATYENPFLTGKDRTWPPERLLIYTYEAVQSWAREQGIEPEPQQTPREFCDRLIERFPDFGPELEQFSFYYSYAAFATQLPDDFETEPIRRLWDYLGDSIMVVGQR